MKQVCFKSPLTSQKEPSPFNTQYQFAWLPLTIGIRSSGGISAQDCSSASVGCRFTSIISSPVVRIYEVRMRVILKNALWCYSQTVYQQPGHFLEWWIEMSGRRMPPSYTHAWHTVWCKACADLHHGSSLPYGSHRSFPQWPGRRPLHQGEGAAAVMAVVEIWTEWRLGERDGAISKSAKSHKRPAPLPRPPTSGPPSADPSIRLAAFVCWTQSGSESSPALCQ